MSDYMGADCTENRKVDNLNAKKALCLTVFGDGVTNHVSWF